jgi:hypothetical protein
MSVYLNFEIPGTASFGVIPLEIGILTQQNTYSFGWRRPSVKIDVEIDCARPTEIEAVRM